MVCEIVIKQNDNWVDTEYLSSQAMNGGVLMANRYISFNRVTSETFWDGTILLRGILLEAKFDIQKWNILQRREAKRCHYEEYGAISFSAMLYWIWFINDLFKVTN